MPARPARGRAVGEDTRRRLVQAAIELLQRDGLDALTTTRVAAAAGIVQSGFYVHFASMEECLAVAAELIAGELRAFVALHRRRHQDDAHGHFRAMLDLCAAQRGFAGVLLRYRREPGVLGDALRRFEDQLRGDLEAELWGEAQRLGAPPADRPRAALLADLLIASVLAAGAGLIDGRHGDPVLVADELGRFAAAVAQDFFGRYGGDVRAPRRGASRPG